MDPHSADLGLLLNTARAFMDREVTTFDEINEIVEIVAPFLGTFGVRKPLMAFTRNKPSLT